MTRPTRIVWATRPPLIQWTEGRNSFARTAVAFVILVAVFGFGLRLLLSVPG